MYMTSLVDELRSFVVSCNKLSTIKQIKYVGDIGEVLGRILEKSRCLSNNSLHDQQDTHQCNKVSKSISSLYHTKSYHQHQRHPQSNHSKFGKIQQRPDKVTSLLIVHISTIQISMKFLDLLINISRLQYFKLRHDHTDHVSGIGVLSISSLVSQRDCITI